MRVSRRQTHACRLLLQDAAGDVAPLVEYQLLVHTSDITKAGTAANVSVQVFGDMVSSDGCSLHTILATLRE